MNEEREKILQQIHDTPMEEILKKGSKKNILRTILSGVKYVALDLLFFPVKFVGSILGVSKYSTSSYKSSPTHRTHGGGASHHSSAASSFRESHHFDPSKAYMDRVQEKAYFSMIDGKGDHDCDHEH